MQDFRLVPIFSGFAETWINERRSGLKRSSLQQYEQILRTQLRPTFGDLKINNIGESRVLQFLTTLQDEGMSARRINLVLLVLKMILKTAKRRKWLRDDPLSEVKMLPEPRTEVDPLSPEEIDSFLAVCPPWWRPYFTVAFWTGARPNELAALKWGDVDSRLGSFRIRAGRYRGIESTPKTPSSVRDVDMLPPVLEALKMQKAQQAALSLMSGAGSPPTEKDYVFSGPAGGLLNINFLRDRVWYPTLTKATLRRRTFYQTRHTFASNALAAGEAPTWVSRMLGHTTPEMLFTVYGRYIPNRTRRDGTALLNRMAEKAICSRSTNPNCNTTEMRLEGEKAEPVAKETKVLRIVGAEGGTRTPTGYPIRPSNVRVYQFHHFGVGAL